MRFMFYFVWKLRKPQGNEGGSSEEVVRADGNGKSAIVAVLYTIFNDCFEQPDNVGDVGLRSRKTDVSMSLCLRTLLHTCYTCTFVCIGAEGA